MLAFCWDAPFNRLVALSVMRPVSREEGCLGRSLHSFCAGLRFCRRRLHRIELRAAQLHSRKPVIRNQWSVISDRARAGFLAPDS